MTILVQSLSEVKRTRSSTNLITKPVLLTIVVNGSLIVQLGKKARLLNVHSMNITKAIQWQESMNELGGFLYHY